MGARRCEDRGGHGAGGFIGPGWHGGRGDDLVVGGGVDGMLVRSLLEFQVVMRTR